MDTVVEEGGMTVGPIALFPRGKGCPKRKPNRPGMSRSINPCISMIINLYSINSDVKLGLISSYIGG